MSRRVVILTPIPFWHPGTLELINKLRENGLTVCSLDIWSLKYYDENGQTHNLCPKIFTGFFLRLFIRLNRKRIIKKKLNKADVVDIQWCGHYYAKYMRDIKSKSHKVIATIFGSDFYRSSLAEKKIQSKIFDAADAIVIGPNMKDDFLAYFPKTESKLSFGQYGSIRLDLIDQMNTVEKNEEIRKKYDIDIDKIIVTIGYNARPEQQHLLFIEQLVYLSTLEKSKLFIVIPMTYGGNNEYINEVKTVLSSTGIDFMCVEKSKITGEKWLTDDELAELRVISNLTVNIQTTDALSSSIKEALLSGDVVITGDWLPYEIYQELGAFIIRSKKETIFNDFQEALNNYPTYKLKTCKNRDLMFNFASWEKLIQPFIDRYTN